MEMLKIIIINNYTIIVFPRTSSLRLEGAQSEERIGYRWGWQISLSLRLCLCLCVCLCRLTHMSKHINIYSLTHCTHTHTLARTHARTRTHTHTHTHSLTRAREHACTHSREEQAVYGLCVLSQPGNFTDAGTHWTPQAYLLTQPPIHLVTKLITPGQSRQLRLKRVVTPALTAGLAETGAVARAG